MISLLGGVALFLFGMTLMGDGLKKVAGNKLEIILYKLTSTPLKGVLLGTGVTAVIQSSSATSVMVVGFVNSGMMQVRQAIGIVLGSILGTSITGWILCLSDISGSGWVSLLSTATLTGVVAVAGIVLRMFCKDLTKHHIGDILLGFAVLMYGMSSMSGAVAPLKDSAAFIELLTRFSNPLLGVLVGTVFTCILQSASAAVGILQALAITGTITFSVAFPITLGIAIGAAVPVLLSSLGASVKGKRTAYVYLLIDVIGALVWGVVFYAVNAAVRFPFLDMTMTTVSIALLNTIFRFATVLLLTPMIPLLEKLVTILFPDKASTGALADIDRRWPSSRAAWPSTPWPVRRRTISCPPSPCWVNSATSSSPPCRRTRRPSTTTRTSSAPTSSRSRARSSRRARRPTCRSTCIRSATSSASATIRSTSARRRRSSTRRRSSSRPPARASSRSCSPP